MDKSVRKRKIGELTLRIEELKARLPKHSAPARMLIELEDLEEELARLEAESGADAR
jgi:hypothetical protein